MKIALSYRVDYYPQAEGLTKSQMKRAEPVPVESYARSVEHYLREAGVEVTNVYTDPQCSLEGFDVYLELDNGRDAAGDLAFGRRRFSSARLQRAVWFVDSHGQGDLHHLLSPHYDHVFFSVWSKRDLFAEHKSAHWCPNATDSRWFYPVVGEPQYDFGFFGSTMGLDRADKMVDICEKHGFAFDVRQVGGPFKHKWPRTCHAMNGCATLFNHGQKHDGPNLRVLESMAIGRPLITDLDPRDGMSKLFVDGEHFLGYEAYTFKGLEEKMLYAKAHPGWCLGMAQKARDLVLGKHLVQHRVQQMLEVFGSV